MIPEPRQQMAARLAEFRDLRARGALCTEVTERLANEAVSVFLGHHDATGNYLDDAITLLAEIATLEEPCLSQLGQRAAFPFLIEKLSDSFDPALCRLYDRVFAQMIAVARGAPAGAKLDAGLRRFGLDTEHALLSRKSRVRSHSPWRGTAEQQMVRKVLVLSRVTLGADVAITSVVLQKAKARFPHAELVLLASAKARELFGGDDSLRFRDLSYPSGGTLLERLEGWLDVAAAVENETRGLVPAEFLLLDPDSRYLQLGLLPAMQDESRYFFFESRGAGASGMKSLSALTLDWLNEMFGGADAILPRVWLRTSDAEFGQRICARLRQGGSDQIVALSFGVGGNQEKRVGAAFEEQLVLRLVEEGCTILLDKGASEDERAQADRIVETVRGRGGRVVEMNADGLPREISEQRCRMLTWHGAIGAWAGLIAASDEYIGYDSSSQHIAAACGVPVIGIFSAAAAPLFRARWQPSGSGIVRVAAEGRRDDKAASPRLLDEVLMAHRGIRVAAMGSPK